MFAERFAASDVSADLTGDDGTVQQVNSSVWSFVSRLAQEYGWRPAGSLPPDGVAESSWEGEYGSNDGQRVSAKDASDFADALDRACADPNREVVERRVNEAVASAVREQALREYGIDLPPDDDDYVSADPAYLAEIAAFLRRGSFRIL